MKRPLLFDSEILLDVLVTYITQFLPRSDWVAFQLVSKQFLWCARELGHTGIRPVIEDLIRVCKRGNLQSATLLLDTYKIDPSEINNGAIVGASRWGHGKVVALLLADRRVDPSDDDNAAIFLASFGGHYEVVSMLLADPRVDPSVNSNSNAVFEACSPKNVRLPLGVPYYGPSAISGASANGSIAVVRLLLADPRVDPSTNNNLAIRWASLYGHFEIVSLLLADPLGRVNPGANNNEAIRVAVRSGFGYHEVMLLLLADPRVDPSANDAEVLISAIRLDYGFGSRSLELVDLLLKDPRVDPSAQGNHIIREVIKFGSPQIIALFRADPRVAPIVNQLCPQRDSSFRALIDFALNEIHAPRGPEPRPPSDTNRPTHRFCF